METFTFLKKVLEVRVINLKWVKVRCFIMDGDKSVKIGIEIINYFHMYSR